MMYIHYCKKCQRIHMLNGHKTKCPKCGAALSELTIAFLDYIGMGINDRKNYERKLQNPEFLDKYSTTYRMYKYSKWYREHVSS